VLADPTGRHAGLLTVHWPGSAVAELQLVDVASGRLLPRIPLVADFLTPSPVFTGDGRSVVTVGPGGVVVWDVRTGQEVAATVRPGPEVDVSSMAADATGRTVALGVGGGRPEVADTVTGELTVEWAPTDGENLALRPLVFSTDGRWLAGGSESGRVVVWDTRSWKVRRSWVAVQGGGVDSLVFTPDSSAVVAGGAGTASIWPVDPAEGSGITLDGSATASGAEVAVAPLDGGATVVTLTEDDGVQLWDISPQAVLEHACDVANRDLTRTEWAEVLPSVPYVRTCSL
jgi:WD40 repeat protein